MKPLTIPIVREFGKRIGARKVLVIAMDDYSYQATSWGATRAECREAGLTLDWLGLALEQAKGTAIAVAVCDVREAGRRLADIAEGNVEAGVYEHDAIDAWARANGRLSALLRRPPDGGSA